MRITPRKDESGTLPQLSERLPDRTAWQYALPRNVQVRVDDRGHILVSGNTHLGYLGDEPAGDEWLDTGDLGARDADGFLSVSGRAKNLLITSFGRNISSEWPTITSSRNA